MKLNASLSVANQWLRHHQNDRNKSIALAKLLSISENSAYKRLYGITPFSLPEALMISTSLGISMNQLLYHEDPLFSANFSGIGSYSCSDYLDLVEKELNNILQHNQKKAWVITNEIPDVYFYFFSELAMFKYYSWERMTWENEKLSAQKFDFNIPELASVPNRLNNMLNKYLQIPVIEIWNYNIFDNVLWQIEYFWKNGDFKNNRIPLILCKRLSDLLFHIEKMVIHGKRFLPGKLLGANNPSFNLYLNEAMQSHNILLVQTNDSFTTYPVLNNPNYIKTSDREVTNYIQELISVLKKQALPLSNVTLKYRRAFFNRITKKVEILERKIMQEPSTDRS